MPFTAIRFGSARICSRFFCCRALMTAPILTSVRVRKRLRKSEIVHRRRRGGRGGGGGAAAGRGGCGLVGNRERAELSGLAERDGVAQARGKKIDSELGDGRAVDFRELHFEQHFLRPYRAEGQDIDHIFGVSLGDHAGALGNIFGGDVSGEHDGGARRGNRDLFVGEDPLFFFRRRAARPHRPASRSCASVPVRPRSAMKLRRRRGHAPESGWA